MIVWVVVAALLGAAGCGGGGGESGSSPTPNKRPDEQLRRTIAASLAQQGRAREASIVTRGGSRLTPLPAPFLRGWKVYQVDYRQGAHPIRLHVANGGAQALLLTGAPKAFGAMTAADGTEIRDASAAIGLARLFLESTRQPGRLTYVVGTVDEIKFRPNITGDDAARRDRVIAEYRPVVKAPAAAAKGNGFAVTAFVVRDRALERRELTVGPDGRIREKVVTLVPDLPVPYTV
ncbi:hypothetical protein [Spirillospora albida]|uniref:hypothetical protein n=1 Tax=Spirillospora albida TaxID=58123 RepID=UPI0004C156C5|nr:hypothetical protein [Spirillospora albida]